MAYVFDSYAQAARILTPKKCANLSEELDLYINVRHIRRNINIYVVTRTEMGSFYLVKHPNSYARKATDTKSVYVLNIKTGLVTSFGSFKLCLSWFNENNYNLSYDHLSSLVNDRKSYVFKDLFLLSLKTIFHSWVLLDKCPEATFLCEKMNKINKVNQSIPL